MTIAGIHTNPETMATIRNYGFWEQSAQSWLAARVELYLRLMIRVSRLYEEAVKVAKYQSRMISDSTLMKIGVNYPFWRRHKESGR